jgi:hypothetical protein
MDEKAAVQELTIRKHGMVVGLETPRKGLSGA